MTVNTCCLQEFLVFNNFFHCVSDRNLALTGWILQSFPIYIHLPNRTPEIFLEVQKQLHLLCAFVGQTKNLKGLSKVTRENVMVFGTFKTIYLSCFILSSAQRLPFHSQSVPAISQYTANKIKLLLVSQSQSGSPAACKNWRCFLTCSLSFGDKVHSFSTIFQIGRNIFLSKSGDLFLSFRAIEFEKYFVCGT